MALHRATFFFERSDLAALSYYKALTVAVEKNQHEAHKTFNSIICFVGKCTISLLVDITVNELQSLLGPVRPSVRGIVASHICSHSYNSIVT